MSDEAYRRVAVRLRTLGATDREWILQQLDAEHCQSIGAALHRLRAQQITEGTTPAASGGWPPMHGVEEARRVRARLAVAPSAAALGVISAQPDWTLAVLLAAEPWPWAGRLEQLGPERVRRVRALSKELGPRVTSTVREAVLRWFIAKLDAQSAGAMKSSAFERNLEWSIQGLSMAGRRHAERV